MTIEHIIQQSIEYRKLRQSIDEHLQAKKISYVELEVLYILNTEELLYPSQISKRLLHERSNVSRILSNLFRRRYIMLSKDYEDQRKIHVQITQQGKEAVEYLRKAI